MSSVPKGIAVNDVPPIQYFFVDSSFPCPRGPPGPTGPTGPIGFSGLGQGATGPEGATGPDGTIGATGPQGAQGATGVQGAQGSPFLGVGATGLAGPSGATGVIGAAGNITIPGNPFGVVIGNSTSNGVASSNVIYSNSTLSVNGDMASDQFLWGTSFGVPQTASSFGSLSGIPQFPLTTLSLDIVNVSSGYSLLDSPAVLCMATMSVRNNLQNGPAIPQSTPTVINSTDFYINTKFVGSITQYPAVGPLFGGINQYQTRQFFTILYRGVDYSAGGVSNVEFNCSLAVTAGIDSSPTELGDYNTYLTAVGLY